MNEQLTDRQQANESSEKYKVLFDSIDQGFCIIELLFDENGKPCDWRFLEVNPAFERQNGLKDATGKRVRELVPGIESHWFEIYGKIVTTGEAIRLIEQSEAMNRWFDVYAFRFGGSGSNKIAVLFTDITEKKRSEEALKEQIKATLHERKVLHDFFMQAPAAFCISKGPEHIYELVNPDYIVLVGNRNVLGKTVREALPELEGQGFFELLDKVYTTGEPFIGKEVEVLVDKGKGPEPAYVNFIYQAYKNVHGQSEGILTFAYDITQQVLARKQLEQAYEDLELKVTFRNLELERLNKENLAKIADYERVITELQSENAKLKENKQEKNP